MMLWNLIDTVRSFTFGKGGMEGNPTFAICTSPSDAMKANTLHLHLAVPNYRIMVHVLITRGEQLLFFTYTVVCLLYFSNKSRNGFGVDLDCSSLPMFDPGIHLLPFLTFTLNTFFSPVVHISCQSSESLHCSAPLGIDRMDPGLIWCLVWDRLRNLYEAGVVNLAFCGTEMDGLTCLWILKQLESMMKRRGMHVRWADLSGQKQDCRHPGQPVILTPLMMWGVVPQVCAWQHWWSEPRKADMGCPPYYNEGRAAP